MKVGVHEGSALSPLLVDTVVDALTRREGWFIDGIVVG